MDDINKIIGRNLLALRKKAKLTQMELAEKFNYSDKSVSKWETGESLPGVDVLYQLSKFYNVNLDYLTSEAPPEIKPVPHNNTQPKAYSSKLVITLLAVICAWLVATILFTTLLVIKQKAYSIVFIWAIPISFILFTIFNSIWGKFRLLFVILTCLNWSLLTAIHLQVLMFGCNLWPLYIVGIPLQIGIFLWDALTKAPHSYNKALRAEKRKERKAKKEALTRQIKEMQNSDNFDKNL